MVKIITSEPLTPKENKVEEKPINNPLVKVYVNGAFLRFQRIKQIPNPGEIFILNHESKLVNQKALIVEAVILGNFFPQVYLKEE